MDKKTIVKWVAEVSIQILNRAFASRSIRQIKRFKLFRLAVSLVLFLMVSSLMAQDNGQTIKVVNENGDPIPGARLELLSTEGADLMTDDQGSVILESDTEGLLKVSYGGMTKTVSLTEDEMEVVLKNADTNMHLGFGREIERDRVTSSLDVVYADQLDKSSVIDPAESLYGQLSGLTVLQNGGEPWSREPDMFVRGKGTFNDNSLLVLVDGFERDISSLSVKEIESVSVLKDGAALALYGQRGANGVVLVTTKRGEYNSFNVDVSFDRGFHTPFRQPDFLGAHDYANAVNEASALDGNPFVYSEHDLADFQSGEYPHFFPNVDWMDKTLKDFGTTTNFNASFRGGEETVKYFVTLNYQNERGIFDNTSLDDRYDSQLEYDVFNFRTNLDIDLTSSTRFYVNVGGSIDGQNMPGARASDVMDALYSIPSGAFPVKTFNDEWGGTEFYDNNPVALVASTGVREPHTRELNADGRLTQDLSPWVEGLSAEVALGYDNRVNYWESKTREFLYESVSIDRNSETGAITDTTVAQYGADTDLEASDSFGGQRRHTTIYGKLNYETSWEASDLSTSVMYHQDKRVNDGQYNTYLHQDLALFGSYGLKNRYFAEGALTYSGSSVLPEGDRFGLFPSLSAAWVLSREDFLKNHSLIDFFKLRASWGLSGNDRMDQNLYDQGFYSGGGYLFTDNNSSSGGIREGQLPSVGLTYEQSSKTNIGLDMELGSLTMALDAFYEKRTNILATIDGSVPSLIGIERPVENVGEVENKGIEASVLLEENTGSLQYHIGGKFSFARNKILEMNEEFQPYDYLKQTGNQVGQQFGLESVGFFKDQEDIDNSPDQLFSEVRPGDVKYRDQNGDDVIDQLDIVPTGHAGGYPEVYFSSQMGLEYKGFGVDALFQGIANQTLYLNTKSVFWPLRGNNTISTFSADRWTPETAESATLPRLSLSDNNNNYRKNDIWLTKGDFLKLRRLEVYYKLPGGLMDRLNMKSAKIFARGRNLFSLDAVDVVDPEATGVTYPTMTSYHFGINLGF